MAFGLLAVSAVPTAVASSEIEYYTFPSIYGGTIDTKQWQGKPYLVVNTASQCAFTKQYASLQKLYDKYRDAGLAMIAVPSDDFNQEFDSDAEVKSFCELNYDIDMPMSETLSVRGQDAHPFFKAVKAESGFAPKWNFNKIDNFEVGLIDEAILTIPLAEYFDPFAEMPTVHNNLRSAHTTMEQLDCVFLRLTDFARTILKGEM